MSNVTDLHMGNINQSGEHRARSSTDVLCAQLCQNNHCECRALLQNQAHVRALCGAQTDATMKISMCARVMIFFQPLLLVNFCL